MTKLKNDLQNKGIKSEGIIVYGPQGSGKTLFSLIFAFERWPKRIYSNFEIYKDGQQINKQLNSVKDIQNIGFSQVPGVVVFDEAGINMNSKDGASKQSRILQEIEFLRRKRNISFIYIAQRYKSIDINVRELANLIVKMRAYGPLEHQYFEGARITQLSNTKTREEFMFDLDLINLLKYYKLSYNTLEDAKFKI